MTKFRVGLFPYPSQSAYPSHWQPQLCSNFLPPATRVMIVTFTVAPPGFICISSWSHGRRGRRQAAPNSAGHSAGLAAAQTEPGLWRPGPGVLCQSRRPMGRLARAKSGCQFFPPLGLSLGHRQLRDLNLTTESAASSSSSESPRESQSRVKVLGPGPARRARKSCRAIPSRPGSPCVSSRYLEM